jgi:XTP/dITP diphosphohydrolase
MQKGPLFVATGNAHKTEEIAAIIGEYFTAVLDLRAVPSAESPEENGQTFTDNAVIKAKALVKAVPAGSFILADDSGLEVDALGGAPGVFSARYSGKHGDDAGHRVKLLRELAEISLAERTARFRCALAVVRDGAVLATFSGTVEGHILPEEKGAGGFGYDALFQPLGYNKSFGELSAEVKNHLSHRARALAEFVSWLQEQ